MTPAAAATARIESWLGSPRSASYSQRRSTSGRRVESMKPIEVNGIDLEYEVVGVGEPALLIHGSPVADAFRLLIAEQALTEATSLSTITGADTRERSARARGGSMLPSVAVLDSS